MSTITSPLLMQQGWLKFYVELPQQVLKNVLDKNFAELDHNITHLLSPGGELYLKLGDYIVIHKTEFILTVRQSPDDEDGIWHDDGSRQLAFSLGLNTTAQEIIGGQLELRRLQSHQPCFSFSPLNWGEVLVFLTGLNAWEHRVLAVQKGYRLHAAGWIN